MPASIDVVTAIRHPSSRNLSALVDVVSDQHLKTRTRLHQLVQVHHGSTVFPQKCMESESTVGRTAYDLPMRVNGASPAAGIAANRTEVSHHALLPEKCAERLRPWQVRPADNSASIVEPGWSPVIASQSL
jgi:hypothetical protein